MSNQQFTNEFFGYPGHDGSQNQNMMDDDQALMAAAVAAVGGGQVPLQMPEQMSGQMQQMSQMSQMQQMPQMVGMAQMQPAQQMQHMQHMQQMPLPGQVLPQGAPDPDTDIMAYLNSPSFFDSFTDMPGILEPNPAEASGAANTNLALPAAPPGSMFPPAVPPSSFTATPTNAGSNMAASSSPDKDSDMLDVGSSDSGPGGANEPGGGPQPVDEFIQTSGASAVTAAGSAAIANNPMASLTEFTRRKNWTAKLVEEMRDVLLIIDSKQRIKFASPSIGSVLGYSAKGAVGLSLDKLVHRDDRAVFLADLNASIASGTKLRLYLRIRKGNYKVRKPHPESGSAVYDDDAGSDHGESSTGGGTNGANDANGGTNGDTNDQDKEGSENPSGPESYCIVEVVGHAHIASPRYATNPTSRSPFCQAVFLVARPYPTKNASLLDSFLEHKMENERLRRRIDDLRREEESEGRDDESHTHSQSQSQAHSQVWRQSIDERSDLGASDAGVPGPVLFRAGVGDPSGISMPPPPIGSLNMGAAGMAGALPAGLSGGLPPAMAGMSREEISNMLAQNPALTRENLEGISARKPDSLLDKMMRYNDGKTDATTDGAAAGPSAQAAGVKRTGGGGGGGGPSAASTISLLTGLYYAEGERSKGLSTGNRSPRLIKGDAGIAISANRTDRGGMAGTSSAVVASDKKKKLRVADEYVCNDCGTLDSPEWRKGPSGPKTLCNACGLRWAKKEKKEKKKAAMGMPGSLGNGDGGAVNGAAGMV